MPNQQRTTNPRQNHLYKWAEFTIKATARCECNSYTHSWFEAMVAQFFRSMLSLFDEQFQDCSVLLGQVVETMVESNLLSSQIRNQHTSPTPCRLLGRIFYANTVRKGILNGHHLVPSRMSTHGSEKNCIQFS